jgi:mucin-like protein
MDRYQLPCQNPTQIQCQTLDGRDWTTTGQVYHCSLQPFTYNGNQYTGGLCINAEQANGQCLDYHVRYLCPASSTTTAQPPNAPTLISPASSWSPAINPSVTFQWQNNGGAGGIQLYFALQIYQWDPNARQWTQYYYNWASGTSAMMNLQPGSYYAWRVLAVDTSHNSNPWWAASGWSYFSTSGGGADLLGRVWNEAEVAGWVGVWTREGTSNIFDGAWSNPNGQKTAGQLRISIQGSSVSIRRELSFSSPNPNYWCNYTGTLWSDGVTVTGTYGCNAPYSGPYNWRATITR